MTMKRILTRLTMLVALLTVAFNSKAQTCNACFTATQDTISAYTILVDATCSTPASFTATFSWYVDGQLYVTVPYATFQIPLFAAGTHTIDLVFDNAGCSDTATQVFTVAAPCNAAFSAYNSNQGNVYFSANQYTLQGYYTWDFGDGATGTSAYTNHVYSNTGTYNVCCVYNDSANNCSDTSCQSISVTNSAVCNAVLYAYADPFAAYVTADAYASMYNTQNYQLNFYVNGTLMQSGTSPYYFQLLNNAGTYSITLTIADTNGVVCDADSTTVVSNGIFGGGGSNCFACFNTSYITSDSIVLDASCAVSATGTYNWSINGAAYVQGPATWGQVFPVGYTTVALQITDSNGNACDSMSSYVYVSPPPCNSCISISQVSGSTSDYILDGTCNTGTNLYYTWIIDNQFVTSGTTPTLNYSFSNSGTYDVCLQVYDQLGSFCTQACSTLVVNTPAATQFDINGTIYKINGSLTYVPVGANEATVYLIKLQTGGILDAVDSTTTDAYGGYKFDNKAIDDYRIKVALKSTSADYASNIPSYYQYATMWYNANVITLFTNLYGKDVYMNYGVNAGGPGFISGNVFQGANKKGRSDDRTEVTLLLVDVNTNLPIAYAKPKANGDYSFSNVPTGQYKLMGELLNRASVAATLDVTNTNNVHTGKNFLFNDNVVTPTSLTLNVNAPAVKEALFTVTPNPASSTVSINTSATESSITVYDITGKAIFTGTTNKPGTTTIDCSQWQSGIYLVEQQTSTGKTTLKLSKQ
jgi:hypothetical protein